MNLTDYPLRDESGGMRFILRIGRQPQSSLPGDVFGLDDQGNIVFVPDPDFPEDDTLVNRLWTLPNATRKRLHDALDGYIVNRYVLMLAVSDGTVYQDLDSFVTAGLWACIHHPFDDFLEWVDQRLTRLRSYTRRATAEELLFAPDSEFHLVNCFDGLVTPMSPKTTGVIVGKRHVLLKVPLRTLDNYRSETKAYVKARMADRFLPQIRRYLCSTPELRAAVSEPEKLVIGGWTAQTSRLYVALVWTEDTTVAFRPNLVWIGADTIWELDDDGKLVHYARCPSRSTLLANGKTFIGRNGVDLAHFYGVGDSRKTVNGGLTKWVRSNFDYEQIQRWGNTGSLSSFVEDCLWDCDGKTLAGIRALIQRRAERLGVGRRSDGTDQIDTVPWGWENDGALYNAFNGMVLLLKNRCVSVRDNDFVVDVPLRQKPFEEQVAFAKANRGKLLAYVLDFLRRDDKVRTRIGDVAYYRVAGMVVRRDSVITITFSPKEGIEKILGEQKVKRLVAAIKKLPPPNQVKMEE